MPISILLTLQTGRTIVQLNKCTRPCDLNEKKKVIKEEEVHMIILRYSPDDYRVRRNVT